MGRHAAGRQLAVGAYLDRAADSRPTASRPTQVTFDEPGTYVLCARADDGALTSDDDVTITVTK